jgi:hypothetical protein
MNFIIFHLFIIIIIIIIIIFLLNILIFFYNRELIALRAIDEKMLTMTIRSIHLWPQDIKYIEATSKNIRKTIISILPQNIVHVYFGLKIIDLTTTTTNYNKKNNKKKSSKKKSSSSTPSSNSNLHKAASSVTVESNELTHRKTYEIQVIRYSDNLEYLLPRIDKYINQYLYFPTVINRIKSML